MPISKKAEERCKTIVLQLQKGGKTTEQLVSLINHDRPYGDEISPRTVQQDLQDLKAGKVWGVRVPIQSSRKTQRHTLPGDFSLYNVKGLDEDDIRALELVSSMLNVFGEHPLFAKFDHAIQTVTEVIGLNQASAFGEEKVRAVIQTDDPSYLKGANYLGMVLSSILHRRVLKFRYQKFGVEEISEKEIAPLLLKEYRGRWYLVGETVSSRNIAVFGLDRVLEMAETGDSFEAPSDFDAATHFDHCLGVTKESGKEAETILLRFTVKQAPYLRTQPLHPSQTILEDNADGLRISIQVIPNFELYQILLGYGNAVVVESPLSVANELAGKLRSALAQYGA